MFLSQQDVSLELQRVEWDKYALSYQKNTNVMLKKKLKLVQRAQGGYSPTSAMHDDKEDTLIGPSMRIANTIDNQEAKTVS